MRILFVEDEEKLARVVVRGLREEGHAIDHCTTVADARRRLESLEYDVVILDWMLPDGDGVELLEGLRRTGVHTPVIVLTARSEIREKVFALRTGADDYLTKPFEFEELLARIEALHRRAAGSLDSWTVGHVVLDGPRRLIRADTDEVELSAREYALLRELFEHAGDVRTRAQLLLDVWGHGFEGDPNILDVYIGYLRQKLARLARAGRRVPEIRAVRGVGFRLSAEAGE